MTGTVFAYQLPDGTLDPDKLCHWKDTPLDELISDDDVPGGLEVGDEVESGDPPVRYEIVLIDREIELATLGTVDFVLHRQIVRD